MSKFNKFKIFGLALCIALCFAMFTACGPGDPVELDKPTEFTFDIATGAYSFKGVENASHYYVRGYRVNGTTEESGYAFSSAQIDHKSGTISGTVDVSNAAYGTYNVKVRTYVEDDTAYTPPALVVLSGKERGGQLTKPEFKVSYDPSPYVYTRSDTETQTQTRTVDGKEITETVPKEIESANPDYGKVTVTLCSTLLSTYSTKQALSDYTISVYKDSDTTAIETHTIAKADITNDEGTLSASLEWDTLQGFLGEVAVEGSVYKVTVKAAAASTTIAASDESEKVTLDTATPENEESDLYTESSNPWGGTNKNFRTRQYALNSAKTTNYKEASSGFPPW